jgi:hypothetical protein
LFAGDRQIMLGPQPCLQSSIDLLEHALVNPSNCRLPDWLRRHPVVSSRRNVNGRSLIVFATNWGSRIRT